MNRVAGSLLALLVTVAKTARAGRRFWSATSWSARPASHYKNPRPPGAPTPPLSLSLPTPYYSCGLRCGCGCAALLHAQQQPAPVQLRCPAGGHGYVSRSFSSCLLLAALRRGVGSLVCTRGVGGGLRIWSGGRLALLVSGADRPARRRPRCVGLVS